MSKRARVVLIGMGPTSMSALEGLVGAFDVVGVARSEDREDPTLQLARRIGSRIEAGTSIGEVTRLIHETDPDCVVVSSYNRILPAELVGERPFLNVHYAPLPRYRGRATVNWSIINGDPYTAISIHELLPDLDSGGILFQETVDIGERDTVTDLYCRLNEIQRNALASAVLRILAGDRGQPQDDSAATYTCTRVPDDGEIDWSKPSIEIDRLVRALTAPFPGAFTWYGLKRVLILRTEMSNSRRFEGSVPGRLASIDRDTGAVEVLTGDGILRVTEVGVNGNSVRPTEIFRSLRCTLGISVSQVVSLLGSPIDGHLQYGT